MFSSFNQSIPQGGLMIMEGMSYESHMSHRLILRAVDCGRCDQAAPWLSAFVTVNITVCCYSFFLLFSYIPVYSLVGHSNDKQLF